MNELKGKICNIQRFSIHDGVGIRTLVFMKGCPLRCLWCSNPESQDFKSQLLFIKNNCIGCGACVKVCKYGAINLKTLEPIRGKCVGCGDCAEACPTDARRLCGREVTVEGLYKEVESDRVFFNSSGGGVTVGGGEPTGQAEFVSAFLAKCRQEGLHTAIESSGYASWERMELTARNACQILFDLKQMDSEQHKRCTAVGNEQILSNAEKITELEKPVLLRIPLIPGYNDGDANMHATGKFVSKLQKKNNKVLVEILPYHNLGESKYDWLCEEYVLKDLGKLSDERKEECNRILEEEGCSVVRKK